MNSPRGGRVTQEPTNYLRGSPVEIGRDYWLQRVNCIVRAIPSRNVFPAKIYEWTSKLITDRLPP